MTSDFDKAKLLKYEVLEKLDYYKVQFVNEGDFETAARCRDAHDVIKNGLHTLHTSKETERLQAAVVLATLATYHELEETVKQEESRANENAREIHKLRMAINEARHNLDNITSPRRAIQILEAVMIPDDVASSAPAAGSADYDRGVECEHE